MGAYYRFQNDKPKVGEQVHCFTTLFNFKNFITMMKRDDPNFKRMKFWEIQGQFIKHDEEDVIVKVISAKEIHL